MVCSRFARGSIAGLDDIRLIRDGRRIGPCLEVKLEGCPGETHAVLGSVTVRLALLRTRFTKTSFKFALEAGRDEFDGRHESDVVQASDVSRDVQVSPVCGEGGREEKQSEIHVVCMVVFCVISCGACAVHLGDLGFNYARTPEAVVCVRVVCFLFVHVPPNPNIPSTQQSPRIALKASGRRQNITRMVASRLRGKSGV